MTSRARGWKSTATPPTSVATSVLVRVLAFARVREIIGASELERPMEAGSTIESLWRTFVAERPELATFDSSIRFACNGKIVDPALTLRDGDEVALLPPVSGG